MSMIKLLEDLLVHFKNQKSIKMYEMKTDPEENGDVYTIRLSRTTVRIKK